MKVSYCRQAVGEVEVFYREAGPADAPVVLLLHGFPTASHMFRDLIPLLAPFSSRLSYYTSSCLPSLLPLISKNIS